MGTFLSKNKQKTLPRRNRLNRSQSEPCPPRSSIVSSHPRRSLSLNTESYVGNKVISILPGTHISFRLNDEVKKKGCCACIMCFFRKEPELPDIVDASFVGPSRASGTDL